MSALDITALSISEIVGDFGYKLFARTSEPLYFAQGSIGYMGVIYFLIRSLRLGNVLYVNGMWDGVSAILESLAAYFILGERLQSAQQYTGLILVILGITLLHSRSIPY